MVPVSSRRLAPHLAAMTLVTLLVIGAILVVNPGINIWALVLIAFVVGVAYRYTVKALGVAPDSWRG